MSPLDAVSKDTALCIKKVVRGTSMYILGTQTTFLCAGMRYRDGYVYVRCIAALAGACYSNQTCIFNILMTLCITK